MITSIHQPSFFPWLGLLDKIAKSSTFVLLNDVAANKSSYQYRNLFYCNGEAKFLSLPVNYKLGIKIVDLQFKNNTWRDEHINKVQNYYKKAPFYDEIFPFIKNLYLENENDSPFEFIKKSMILLLQLYGIKINIIESSDLNCKDKKGDLVLELCKKIGDDTYLSGKGALVYMNDEVVENFKQNNIQIKWHSFHHPKYLQFSKFEFVEGLSAVDLLFFKGLKEAKSIFWSNVTN